MYSSSSFLQIMRTSLKSWMGLNFHKIGSAAIERLENSQRHIMGEMFKDKDYCPIEIIKGLTDKGQFQYLTKLMGPQEGTYLYATQFHSLR